MSEQQTTIQQDSSVPKEIRSAFNVRIHDKLVGHLHFWTREGWSGDIPIEQQNLQVEFDKVCSVLRARFQKRFPDVFEEELHRLLGIAQATFSSEYVQIEHGIKSLRAYKDEIVSREGGGIKNEYLKELAKSAAWASVLILSVSIGIRIVIYFGEKYGFVTTETESKVLLSSAKWNSHYSPIHFGFLLTASMWGIWLSFVVRNMNLTFEQLQNPESDLMRPWSRLLAFGLLAFILTLFFQMEVLVITVGGVSTSQISDNIVIAIFVGLCLGFTDQALPSRVQKRIEEFFQDARTNTT